MSTSFVPFFQELALEAARESMILLKNTDSKKNHRLKSRQEVNRLRFFIFFVFHLNHFPVNFVNFQ